MDTEPADVDLGGEDQPDDPLAEVEAETVFDEDGTEEAAPPIPPGVEQGTLGGDNPSEEPPAEAAPSPDPLQPDEFLADPEEEAVEEEPVPAPEPDPTPEPTPEPAPEPEPTPEPEPVATPDSVPEPEPDEPTAEAPEPATEVPPSEEEPSPASPTTAEEPETPKPTPRRRGRGRKKKTPAKPRPGKGDDIRGYVPVEAAEGYTAEQLVALAAEGRLFITHPPVESRSGEYALRKTFHALSDGEEASFTLIAVPAKLWKPKKVSGKKLDQMAISVG